MPKSERYLNPKKDHCPIEEHEMYQKRKFDKLARFYKSLKEWDANRDKFDDIDDLKNVDTDINELFGLWKEQRLLTQTAVKVNRFFSVIFQFLERVLMEHIESKNS